jgi:hypothetical protein
VGCVVFRPLPYIQAEPSSRVIVPPICWTYEFFIVTSGQINMRKVDGWQTLNAKPTDQPIDLAA